MAGRRDSARTAPDVLLVVRVEETSSAGKGRGELVGARRARSIMKLPARRLDGVRGRWRWKVIS